MVLLFFKRFSILKNFERLFTSVVYFRSSCLIKFNFLYCLLDMSEEKVDLDQIEENSLDTEAYLQKEIEDETTMLSTIGTALGNELLDYYLASIYVLQSCHSLGVILCLD